MCAKSSQIKCKDKGAFCKINPKTRYLRKDGLGRSLEQWSRWQVLSKLTKVVKKVEKEHDTWKKQRRKQWLEEDHLFPVVSKPHYNKEHQRSQWKTFSIAFVCQMEISKPGGMGVSTQRRWLLLQFEWSLEMPFRRPWRRQQFLVCLVKDCSVLIYTKHTHKVLWRPTRRGELSLFQTKFKILMNFQLMLSVKFARHSKGSGTI